MTFAFTYKPSHLYGYTRYVQCISVIDRSLDRGSESIDITFSPPHCEINLKLEFLSIAFIFKFDSRERY